MKSARRMGISTCLGWGLMVMGLGLAVRADYAAQLFPNGPAPYPAYGGEVRIGAIGESFLLSLRVDDPARVDFHQIQFTSNDRQVVTVLLGPPTPYVDPAAPPGNPGWGHVDYGARFELSASTAAALLAGSWLAEVGAPGADGSLSSRSMLPLAGWSWRFPTPGHREARSERTVAIAHGAGRYVALIVGGTPSLASSPDGLLWDVNALEPTESPQAVAWAGDRFLAVGNRGNSLLILSSTNGESWASRRFVAQPDDGMLSEIAFQNGMYALQGFVRYGRRTTGTVVLTSHDAEQWTAKYEPVPSELGISSGHRNLVAGNGVFLRLAWAFATTAGWPEVSTNATDWVASSRPTQPFTSVAFGNGTFLAIDVEGNVMSSVNGQSWNRMGSSPTPALYSTVGFAGGAFYLPSANGLAASIAGASWSWSYFPSNVVMISVARGGETFCGAGYRVVLTAEGTTGPDIGPVIYQAGAPEPWLTRLGRPRRDAAGKLWVAAQGAPGIPLGLQVSTNLETWAESGAQANPEGIVEFEIPTNDRAGSQLMIRARKGMEGMIP
ncbi:MAG: hypothetical protein IT581_20960 [Verrucomicrobiales bacterium]|nr:hypothetical protein [Verrucomicrobiales bacterium]